RRLGFKALEELCDKEASEMAITLSSSAGLRALLEEPEMGHNMVQLLCRVLSKAIGSRSDRRIVQHLAGAVKDSGFIRTILPHYVAGMMSDHIPARRAQYPEHLDNIVSLLSDVVSIFPASSVQVAAMLVALLKAAINSLRASGVDVHERTEKNLEKIQELATHLQEKARDGTLRSDNYTFLTPDEDAPPGEGDFRTMTIYPSPEEIHQEQKPFLRPNVTSCSYPSIQLYLDTHFRLLREDFVRPLREGIQQLLQSYQEQTLAQGPLRKKRFDDIRVYFDTRLLVPLCAPSGTAFKVCFDPRPLKFVRWQNSKRLLYGSLVCMSRDNFESFLFATVSDRDPAELSKGVVQLSFCRESRPALAEVQASHSFLMVETTAYFEAYRHVLEGLQEMQEEDLPFQRYIVECQTELAPPAYLTMGETYDLTAIMAPGKEESGVLMPFVALDTHAWPSMEQLGLDESQMRALQLALTKELAIIQGPPGTGKTYVGLKIAQALLTNTRVWQRDLETPPVLVVCYTNHALDQFLEGIHTFLDSGIVRVGGRSNSEILKRFTLRELRGGPNFRRSLPPHLRRAYFELWDGFQRYGQKQSLILEWLGLGSSAFQQKGGGEAVENGDNRALVTIHDTRAASQVGSWTLRPLLPRMRRMVQAILSVRVWVDFWNKVSITSSLSTALSEEEEDEPEQEEEELVEVEEEAELIQADRIIEEGELRGHALRKKKDDTAVKEMAELLLAMSLDKTDERGPTQSQDGWQTQRAQKKKMKQRVRRELLKSSAMSEEEEERLWDVWRLNLRDRWRLYRLWLSRYQTDMRARALHSEQAYQDAAERLAEIRLREDLCILKEARVIGMTTTGAAKYRRALQEVRPRLVIVEEAAEVLEAHTITTLSQSCQHLILIGDHQQQNHMQIYNLSLSLFTLLTQGLIATKYIFPFFSLSGLHSNLFFVEHQFPEQEIQDGRSHQNPHEACFLVALCRYLMCQDYQPSQITILTTYTGQLHCLRKLLPANQFSGVKVHVVDKYQGEENDIVLLSLVRSNPEGRVGFLQIANRVCVALSRAKKGLYCIGNMAMFGKVSLWSNILHTLRERGQVGSGLILCCQNHPGTRAMVSSAQDFLQAPEGGCSRPCEFRLECGHVCTRACHPYDADHKMFQCLKPCQKVLCELGHRCPGLCFQECDECKVRVEKQIPYCGHNQKVPCYLDPLDFICLEPCSKKLRCGHPCDSVCGDACTPRCQVRVIMKLQCGHQQEDACHYTRQMTGQGAICRVKCSEKLKCDHPCPGTCHWCHQGRFHKGCSLPCGRLLVCSHVCREPCTKECPPCQLPCQNRCVHSACKKICGQPCAPCVEPCAWQCPHFRCTKLCHEPCDRPPCNQPCGKALGCGHPCIGLCGDPCPDKCRVCNQDEVTEIFFGMEDEPLAYFVQLEDCSHFLESSSMDHYMSMDKEPGADLELMAIKLKECPKCRTPIRRNLRYGAAINRSLAEIEKVKARLHGSPLEIEKKQKALVRLLKEQVAFHLYLPEEYKQLKGQLGEGGLSLRALGILENKIAFYGRLGKLKKVEKDMLSEDLLQFSKRIVECMEWLKCPDLSFSEQQATDLQSEIQRLTYLAELNARCKQASNRELGATVHLQVATLREGLEGTTPFTQKDEQWAQKAMEDLNAYLPRSGLGISDKERVMIVKAMGLAQGHWYKCPNGHVYAIGDCGGAMETQKCPECKAVIGGANHALASGNQLASEMDGARHAAWSDAANMLNYDMERLRL
ncbi:ZNFX1 protein, partial [Amia calva]|nr:ZNFX1 protein [Amia calva]